MKILIAEDEPIMLKMLQMRLQKEGYEVLVASDGREAMHHLAEQAPDMLITDIMMPYSSGLELLGAARQQTDKRIPVIILSSMGQEDIVLEAFRLGVDDYLPKPFSPNELSIRVKRLLVKN